MNDSRQDKDLDSEKMEYIYKIMEKINSANDINIVGRDIVDIMSNALDCIGGALFIVEEEGEILRPFTYSRISTFTEKVIPILPKSFSDYFFDLKKHKNYTVRTVTEKKMFVGNKYEEFMMPIHSKFFSRVIQKLVGMKSIVSSPTMIMGKVVGVFQIAFREKEINERKKRLIKFFSDQCAVAINNAQKYQKLQNQYSKMQEIIKQQSDFMAVTAHEFRTPLSIAIFQLEELINKSPQHSQLKHDLSVVEASLSNLKKLTQKLFAIQQYDLKKVKIHKEKVDLKTFIKNLHKDFLPIIKEKKLNFKLEDSLKEKTVLNIDAPQIRQVLHNLLNNACKFTDDGQITLGIKKIQNNILIYVKDTGRGVPDHMKKSVFNKFRTNSAESGIGLGLYICQKIIELHQGKIWVEDTPGGGSTFFIQLKSDVLS